MKKQVRLVSFCLIVLFFLAAVGCGGGGSDSGAKADTANQGSNSGATNPPPADPANPGSDTGTVTPPATDNPNGGTGTTNPPADPPSTDTGTTPPVDDVTPPPVSDPAPPPTTDPIEDPPTTQNPVSLAAVPAGDYDEKINVLVNQDYASAHMDVAIKASAMVDEVNLVFAKNTKKRFLLNSVIIYQDASSLESISSSQSNFIDNNFAGNSKFGGTSLIFWMQDSISVATPAPKFFTDRVGNATAFAGGAYFNGKTYGALYLAQESGQNLLLGRSAFGSYLNGFSGYDAALGVLIHEIEHNLGMGIPEWYSLNFKDNSGTLPNLGTYDFKGYFFEDPLSSADVLKYDKQQNKLSVFSAWLADHNANCQLNAWQIAEAVKSMTVKVKVVDVAGNPIPGATVTAFGAVASSGSSWGIAKDMVQLLEAKTTGVDGFVTLTNDFNAAWFVKGVKATHGGKYAGNVINTVELEQTYWMLGSSSFVLTLTMP